MAAVVSLLLIHPAGAATPKRIISLSPTATESLFAIGAGAQVVAVDDRTILFRWHQPFADAGDLQARDLPPLPRHILETPFMTVPSDAFVALPFWLNEYVGLAYDAIQAIHARGKIPIMAGSAGLYIRAVCAPVIA